MARDEPLTPLEREIETQWRAISPGRCLTGEEIVTLATLGLRWQRYEAAMDHVAACDACLRLLTQLRSLESKAGRQGVSRPRPWNLQLAAAGAAVAAVAFAWIGIGTYRSSRVVVSVHDSGGLVAVTASNRLTGLSALPLAEQNLIAGALRSGRVETPPVLAGLRESGTAARAPFAFSVAAPHGIVVASLQPEFTWKLPAGASTCRIFLACAGNAGRSVATGHLTSERWVPKKPLLQGAVYSWQVAAYDSQGRELQRVPGPVRTLRFKVLDQESAARLDRLRQSAGSSHLAMGLGYAREGLIEEAEGEFAALRQVNPGSGRIRALLESVRALREG